MKRTKLKDNQYFHPYKFKMYPTDRQKAIIDDFINQYRFVYNWGIEMERKRYEAYLKGNEEYSFYSYKELREIFKEHKKSLPWFTLPSETTRNALQSVEQSYIHFFKGLNKHPKFKSKKKSKMSFKTRNDTFHVYGDSVSFEMYRDLANKYDERKISLGFNSGFTKETKCYNPTISKDSNGDYYISFSIIEDKTSIDLKYDNAIGIDVGIRNTLTTSQLVNNTHYHHQPWNKINKITSRIKRLDRQILNDRKRRERKAQSLSDKTGTRVKASDIPKSKRELKREEQRRKDYKTIHNVKTTYYHTITKNIVTSGYSAIGIEDIKVSKCQQNNPHYISKHIPKVSFYTIRTYIEYKGNMFNVPVFIADKNYPSTQICSCCGNQKKVDLSETTYICPVCGNTMDRDLNAAYNLESQAYNYFYGVSNELVA